MNFTEAFSTFFLFLLAIFYANQFNVRAAQRSCELPAVEDDDSIDDFELTEVDSVNAEQSHDVMQEENTEELENESQTVAESETVIDEEDPEEDIDYIDLEEERIQQFSRLESITAALSQDIIEDEYAVLGELNVMEIEQPSNNNNNHGDGLIHDAEDDYVQQTNDAVANAAHEEQNEEDNFLHLECPVCFCDVNPDDSAFLTHCGHWYHSQTCFMPWYYRKKECPKCRAEISNNRSDEALEYWDDVLLKPQESVETDNLVSYLNYLVVTNMGDVVQYIQVVSYLIEVRGWNVDSRYAQGRTMLITAVLNDNLDAVMALLNMGANRDIEDDDSVTAAAYALSLNHQEIYQYLTGDN